MFGSSQFVKTDYIMDKILGEKHCIFRIKDEEILLAANIPSADTNKPSMESFLNIFSVQIIYNLVFNTYIYPLSILLASEISIMNFYELI